MNEKLTAYALNELPPDERADFEAQMKADAALRAQAEETKAFCTMLSIEIADDQAALTAEQRGSVVRAFRNEPVPTKRAHPLWQRPAFLVPAALAACVAAMLMLDAKQELVVVQQPVSAPQVNTPKLSEHVSVVGGKYEERSRASNTSESNVLAVGIPATPIPMPQSASLERARPDMPELLAAAPEAKPVASPSMDLMALSPMSAPAEAADAAPPASAIGAGSSIAQNGRASASRAMPIDDFSKVAPSSIQAIEKHSPASTPAPLPAAPVGTPMTGQPARPGLMTSSATSIPQLTVGYDSDYVFRGRTTVTAPEESRPLKAKRESSGETYTRIHENPFLFVAQQPLSTFSIDVDTASYANVRRFLNEGLRPPTDAVRLEELINYFPYNYEGPSDGKPFGVMVDVAEAPWQPMHRLVRVALKGREVKEERGAANFVFLVDVSGSMDSPDRLPLVQRSLEMLTRQLGEKDRV
ncbi:MAG: VWA domain-containing protein, partial [Roseimicrobium sp.]